MKCLGARSSHLMRIYLIQTIALGLRRRTAGRGVRTSSSSESSRDSSRATSSWSPPRIGTSSPPRKASESRSWRRCSSRCRRCSRIRRIRPSLILRREMAEAKPDWRTRLAQARASIAAGVVIVVGIAGIAMSFATGTPTDIWKTGAYFAGALVVSLAVLSADRVADAARSEACQPPQAAHLHPPRHRESVSPRQSCADRVGGARRSA